MNETVDGLILKQMDYREADVILTVLTREYGKISLVAKSARKASSKNAGSILPCTLANLSFDYKDGKTMFRLKTARVKNLYRGIHEHLEKSLAAQAIAETIDAVSLPGLENEDIQGEYDLVLKCWNDLDNYDETTILTLFLADLLKILGIAPEVDECVVCGKKKVAAISAKEGGFLCQEHAVSSQVKLSSIEDLKRFRLVNKAGISHIEEVRKAGGAKGSDLLILEEILRLHAGIEVRIFSLYNQLFIIV